MTTTTLIEEVEALAVLPAPEEVHAILENAHVSISRLAKDLGRNRVTVSRWVNGTRLPKSLNIDDLLAQGDTCSVEDTAVVLKISRGAAYAAVKAGEIPALHIGARWIVPTRRLAALLGAVDEESA